MGGKYEDEVGAFNAALQYLETVTSIEREIDLNLIKKDYDKLNDLIDVFWIELSEWMNPNEDEIHKELRKNQKLAHKGIREHINLGKKQIPMVHHDAFIERIIQLKRLFHSKGLRMAKKDNVLEMMKKAND